MNSVEISVVIPVYGCPEALEELHERLCAVIDKMAVEYEIIMVDDCCPYNSWEKVKRICERDTHVKGIHFTKNFGQMRAITAGVEAAGGKWIITMDCDLQDIPENIPELYSKAQEGFDVVFVRRMKRKDPIITQLWGRLFHKVFSYLSEIDFDFDLATYLIASRRATDKYIESDDRWRDFGMYLMWLGYNKTYICFEHGDRHSGKSSYSFTKKVQYAINTMTTFSNRLLYLPIHVGAISAIGSLLYLLYIMYTYFILGVNPEGWTTIAASIFLFGGLILSALGIIGIYIGNIFESSKKRPLYVIQDTLNLNISNRV